MAKRAHVNEHGVAVCFAYNNLLTTLLIGVVEDVVRFVPTVGSLIEMAISILTFYFHRIVLVTDQNVYVYRDWLGHIPGKQLAAYLEETNKKRPLPSDKQPLDLKNLKLVALVSPLRASAKDEGIGMDVTQHGEEAYSRGEGAILVHADRG